MGLPTRLIEPGTKVKTVSKQCQTVTYPCSPLQLAIELHQKDLRINPVLVHIWDPENEAVLRADMFLALFLIVRFYVSRGSYCRRRVDIPVIRPCQLLDLSQNLRI